MEDEDFVADSDEDEQEMLEALAMAEERLARQRLEASNHEQTERQDDEDHEQNVAIVVTPEQPQTVQEHDSVHVDTVGNQEQNAEVETDEEQEHDGEEVTDNEQDDSEETEGVLDVGTLVEVESRTWPGINKQGGAGRVTRVHREMSNDGEAEEIFYDVRYVVEGGFERHIERKYVHSSDFLNRHSNRKPIDREYYHDDYINKPHEQKQRKAERKRAQMIEHHEQVEKREQQRRKRKRSHISTRAERVPEKPDQDPPSNSEDKMEHKRKVPKIDEDMFVLSESNKNTLQVSSRPPSTSKNSVREAPSPLLKQSSVKQRRRHRILDSSDEESSAGDDAGDNLSHNLDQPEHLQRKDARANELLADGKNAQSSREENPVDHNRRRIKKRKTNRRRFVGGYEHNEEDPDGRFIQPEGNPDELPVDVIRETGIRLKKTKDGLMKQLQEVFAQHQKNMADFHEEQKMVDRKMKDLSGMPLSELQDLHHKVFNLDKVFLTKTLVNAGEDVMDSISNKLDSHGKPPSGFEQLDNEISDWKEKLKDCSRWVTTVKDAVEDAFARRNAQIPVVQVAQAEYSSDSSYSADDFGADDLPIETADADAVSDAIDFSFEYDVQSTGNAENQHRKPGRVSKARERRPTVSKAAKLSHRKTSVRTTTLDDYFSQRGPSNSYRSNFRLIGRQKKILPSDPRFDWVRMARKKQQRAGTGFRHRSTGPSSLDFSNRHGSVHAVHEVRSTNVSSQEDKKSVQAQRMQLRNERFRAQPQQQRPRESFPARSAPQTMRSSSQAVYPPGIAFDDFIPEKRRRQSEIANPIIRPSNSNQQAVNWEAIFEVVFDGPSTSADEDIIAISRQGQEGLLAFGHPICGPLIPPHLFSDDEFGFEDCDNFRPVITRQASHLRQLVNDLRLQENTFMDSLSRGGLGAIDEEGYANTPEWILLVSLEEAYHRAIASFAVQLLQALEVVSPSVLPSCLKAILEEITALVRQLPDCDSLFNGCKAYFFFFEVASRDATTTPLLTAVSRTYWYCLNLLVALRPLSDRLVGSHKTAKQEVEDVFLRVLPVNRLILAVVLFLFDWYIYLPSSHRAEDKRIDELPSGSPALSLWMLVRGCCTSPTGVDQPDHESRSVKEKHFWALLQAVYRQRYFDELARCFVRSESCGGYLRDFEPNTTDAGKTEYCAEAFECQLLALETTWDLLAVLTRIYADPDDVKYEEAVCDAKWAVVKDLLQPGKPDFLPFTAPPSLAANLQSDYRQFANLYKYSVLKRVTSFSKQWLPSKEIVELIVRQLWGSDEPHHSDDIVELPQLLKQFTTRCKELGNSRLRLLAFAGEHGEGGDTTTALCKIIWIQLLKLEKRVHRSRFRRVVLNAIPNTPDNQHVSTLSASAHQAAPTTAGTNWIWGPQPHPPANVQQVQRPEVLPQRSPTSTGIGKERLSTAVLLVFAVVGVCMECGDEQQFSVERPDKDVRYMEREVDFYCKEIQRWTSGKPACEVLAAQALFTLGALLLEKNSTEFPTVFKGLNERLVSSVVKLQANPLVSPTLEQPSGTRTGATKTSNLDDRRQRLQNAAMSPLYQIRDLTRKMIEMPSSGIRIGPAFGPAVEMSLEHIFSAGMEACLIAATQKIITVNDLKIAMEIFQLVLPRVPDEPKQCFGSTPGGFDEALDDALAEVDMERLQSGGGPRPAPAWTVKKCRSKVVQQLITSNLRLAVQQLVLKYPSTGVPTFAELYAIDLLGMIISTCTAQFYWNHVTSAAVKPRNLAPRVLSAALKYNPEKEWLRNVFLRESGSDQDLSTAWLLGTLDAAALNSTPIEFTLEDVPFGVIAHKESTHSQSRIRDSAYWVMLTDGIIYHLLRSDSVGFGAMDPQVLKLLRDVASTCKFLSSVRANEAAPHDVARLYDLHLDVFQSFCKSAGSTWSTYTASGSSNWHEMNQFRIKMVNAPSGVFISFLEAYKLNFRRACSEIDHWNHSWHMFGKLFLRQAGVNATGGRSYHEMDDTIKSFDERLTGLTTMFRFMYQCMDALLFYCGEMAIGDTNLFFSAMELLFRQVNSAEYPQAIKRLEDQRRQVQRDGVRSVSDELRKGFCSASVRFVDSVQLFFARQKYPSLLHWFAQTSEIYQTFKTGWSKSHLRTLLLNILDPDGPLGIHSYYPDEEASKDATLDIDVKAVRREAFYLSCGFFNCRCTRSFEHSRAQPGLASYERLQQLRKFVLGDFMWKTFSFVLEEDVTSLLETMVPLCQFVRAVLNHANLNISNHDEPGAENDLDNLAHFDFQLSELHSCLEWMVECLIKLVPGEEAVNNTLCCVLLTELCGIICEAITFNDKRSMLELIDLIELVLSYLQTVYVALSKRTTATISTLFAACVELPPSVKLSAYRFSPSAFRDLVVEQRFKQISGRQMDSYGIRLARAATDLLPAIGRVAQHCKESSDERLRGFTTTSP